MGGSWDSGMIESGGCCVLSGDIRMDEVLAQMIWIQAEY